MAAASCDKSNAVTIPHIIYITIDLSESFTVIFDNMVAKVQNKYQNASK
jgi:hypothetical protein